MLARILLSFFIIPFMALEVNAQEAFNIDAEVYYEVRATGETIVKKDITIENIGSNLYPASYTLNLNNLDPYNISVVENEQPLSFDIIKDDKNTKINIDLDDPIAGEGKSRSFSVNYSDDNLAKKTGEVWEIIIPKLDSDSFRSYQATLIVPESFGEEAFVSPGVREIKTNGKRNYIFDKNILTNSSATTVFGKFQVFSFSLTYHLENPINKKSETTIALPPDTSLQKVYYSQIEPTPDKVSVDADGNWLASYHLSPRQRLDITAKGSVQIFANPTAFLTPLPGSLLANTKPTKYWQSDSQAIKALARELKTPKNIYSFVVNTLNYNYRKAKPDTKRLGALGALEQPDNAICMEFTDLFIAIARAAGIPAREINGYAYTENPKIQPLSLVSDVLHAWPEYWDDERGTWIPVDPTWESTTGGSDFFENLDLRHFAFVIHGQDPTYPFPPGSYKLGANPQKDVFVNFGELPKSKASNISIEAKKQKSISPLIDKLEISVNNTGNAAAYDVAAKVLIDQKQVSSRFIEILPPTASEKLTIDITYGIMGRKAPKTILISAGSKNLIIPVEKKTAAIQQLIIVSTFIILALVFVHPKRPKFSLFGKAIDKILLNARRKF